MHECITMQQCEGHADAACGLQVRKSHWTCVWNTYCPSVCHFALERIRRLLRRTAVGQTVATETVPVQ